MAAKDYKDMKKKLDSYVKKPSSNKDDQKKVMYGEQTDRNYKDGDRN